MKSWREGKEKARETLSNNYEIRSRHLKTNHSTSLIRECVRA